MKIIKLSPADRKIGLSIRALKSDEIRTEWAEYSSSQGEGGATLGEHFRFRNDPVRTGTGTDGCRLSRISTRSAALTRR